MKAQMIDDVEVSTDGYTVWVQGVVEPLARHSSRLSEIHGRDHGAWSWEEFRKKVGQHFGVGIPEDFMFSEPEYEGDYGRVMRVSVARLRENWDPLYSHPSTWHIPEVSTKDLRHAIRHAFANGQYVEQPFRPVPGLPLWDIKKHAGRIAYLMRTKWKYPLELDMQRGSILCCEGNHRLAAAIMRGDRLVRVVFTGIHREDRRVVWERLRP